MKTKRKTFAHDWELDGETVVVTVPMIWKRRGGRKVIIAPDGGDAWAPAKPRPDETLIRALARAHRWQRMLEEGEVSIGGDAEAVMRSFVNRMMRLTLLAPDIVEAIPERGGGRRGCCWRQVPVSRRTGRSRRRRHPPAAAHPAGAAYR